MSQKSSLPQPADSVPRVLTADNRRWPRRSARPPQRHQVGKIVGPVLRGYVQEFRTKIADLTARIVALEAENDHLRGKMALLSEQRRQMRPISISTNERIAHIERQMEEAEDAAD
jgi:hypothetical protein